MSKLCLCIVVIGNCYVEIINAAINYVLINVLLFHFWMVL